MSILPQSWSASLILSSKSAPWGPIPLRISCPPVKKMSTKLLSAKVFSSHLLSILGCWPPHCPLASALPRKCQRPENILKFRPEQVKNAGRLPAKRSYQPETYCQNLLATARDFSSRRRPPVELHLVTASEWVIAEEVG